jgi:hypothetical protein
MYHEDVTAVVWQDKRVVLHLSTHFGTWTDGSVTRKTGKGTEEIEIACPQAVIIYTKHMGVVDVSDQERQYYGVGRSYKMLVIYITFRPKYLSCELFDLIGPDKYYPHLQHTETCNWLSDETSRVS